MLASKFPLGRLLATPGVVAAFNPEFVFNSVSRHARGDWGDVDSSDAQENDFSLNEGFRLLSAYDAPEGGRLWVITEADRSATTALLPEEY